MAKKQGQISPEEINGAESIVGKVLIHVRKLEPSSGCGVALCFGDKISDKEGPMAVVRVEPIGGQGLFGGPSEQMVLKFYYNGRWKDKEMVLN